MGEVASAGSPASARKVLDALGALRTGSGQEIAQRAGVAYSTATQALRVLERTGRIERCGDDPRRRSWRLRAVTDTAVSEARDSGSGVLPAKDEADTSPEAPASVADGPAVSGPAASDPTVPDPAVPDPAAPDPAVPGPAAPDPAVPGPAGFDDAPPSADTSTVPGPGATAEVGSAPPEVVDAPDAADVPEPALAQAPGERAARRRKGQLAAEVLAVFSAAPDERLTVVQIARLVDRAAQGSGFARASEGAVSNALHLHASAGRLVRVADRPATFACAPGAGQPTTAR